MLQGVVVKFSKINWLSFISYFVQNFLSFREISLGDHNLVTDPDCGQETCDCNEVECAAPSVRRKITSEDQIIIHENYNPNAKNNIENDIALVTVNPPFDLNSPHVSKIVLEEKRDQIPKGMNL